MASTYLTRTPSSTGNRQIFTFSAWVKRSSITTSDTLFYTGPNAATSGMISLRFTSSGTINVYQTDIGSFITTNRLFRDTSAWYHIVLAIDTTQATPDDRRKLYINGVQETSFSTSTEINRNLSLSVNTSGQLQRIGTYADSSGTLENQFNGSMSYVAFVDGTAELPTIFGETDSVTGQWKIKTDITPSVAWGTNGFLILKNGNSLTDESTNTNNFTLGAGTLTNTLDCPDNVFATLNPLENFYSNYTYAQGNTAVASTSSNRTYVTSTLAMPSGKYYWECKLDATIGDSGGASTSVYVGITGQTPISPSQFPSDGTCFNCVMNTNGQVYSNGSTIGSAMGSSWATSTFVMMAYDADNNKMYFGKDGVWLNSGDPTSGATGTGAFTPTTAASATPIGVYMPMWGVDFNASYGTSFNFGNGYFGTSAVTSAGTAGSTPGTFEYDVPSGYQPLSTKGLNA
jgi:hypothetical protein